MYKYIIKPILFLLSPETAHHFAMKSLKLILSIPGKKYFFKKFFIIENSKLSKKVFGLNFPNPVGLAAGFDKNAQYIDELACLGFGFVEIGTVTPKPQPGNPRPRLFRLPKDQGLINRMGFNNDGVDKVVERLKKKKSRIIVGGNIGKNKVTTNEDAVKDYEICFEKLFDHVDYFVVNVSSPNTPGLRELQEKGPLTKILNNLQKINYQKQNVKPILLKIAPDLTKEQLNDIIEIVKETKINGVIATNTTISREKLKTRNPKPALPAGRLETIGSGGLSGQPVKEKSTEVIKYLNEKSNGAFNIIGVGGIHSYEDAKEKLNAGADLVQIYTGFIYSGPTLPKQICKEILK